MRRISFNTCFRLAAAVSMSALLAACAHDSGSLPMATARPTPATINPDYQAGQINLPTTPVLSLEEMIGRVPSRKPSAKNEEDRLRAPAMADAAMAYGIQGGLAWESRAINQMLQSQSHDLAVNYNFQPVMIRGTDNDMILPPVISQMEETYETSDGGRTLRVADTYYEIIAPARFAPVAPMWQEYLLRTYNQPAPPPDMLLPRDGAERDAWARSIAQGWERGKQQANEIFKADLARIERDLVGMVLYKQLLEEGKVSAPVVAGTRLGTTGTGQDMRVNDRAVRITQDSTLQVGQPQNWQAVPTTALPDGGVTNNDPSKPQPACPPGTTPAAKQVSSTLVCVQGSSARPAAPVPAQRATRPAEAGERAAWSSF